MILLALAAVAAACSREPLGATAGVDTPDAAVGQGAPQTEEEWRAAMARAPLPHDGCFQASYPGDWQAVPCTTPPDVPLAPAHGAGAPPLLVGAFGDFTAEVTGPISWAEGSFPIVKNVTSVTDVTVDNFSLQLNTNTFATAACSGGLQGCQGWQQFVYDSPGTVFIQYWLLNYGNACPAGWNTSMPNCWRNSTESVATPLLSGKNLAHFVLAARAGSSDGAVLSTGNGNLYAVSQTSILGLNSGWNAAEFNLFGHGSGSTATFNAGATVVVRTVTSSAPPTTNAPTCEVRSFTGETNDLSLVQNSCCALGGATPGIQFTESNSMSATAEPCPAYLQTAAVCGRSPTGLRCAKSNGTDFDEISLWTPYFSDPLWSNPQHYSTIQFPDIDGNGSSDVCGRSPDGIECGKYLGDSFADPAVWAPFFSDANGWAFSYYYSTIRFPDLNGDGKADVCGRYSDGLHCGLSSGVGYPSTPLWHSSFSDAAGWTFQEYYSTIAFPDVNGDGKADVCARAGSGIKCALSTGTSFGSLSTWSSVFSDGGGWDQPQYYSTIKFPDLNGDGKADVCGRGGSGIKCALSTGTSFGSVSTWASLYSDAGGWDQPQFYSTIVFGDLNGDGKADVCGRGANLYKCALSTGSTFGSPTTWQTSLSDAAGWGVPECYSTLRLVDINHDGKADVCGRSPDGSKCAKSTGSTFGSLTTWDSYFMNTSGWDTEPYYSTISFIHE